MGGGIAKGRKTIKLSSGSNAYRKKTKPVAPPAAIPVSKQAEPEEEIPTASPVTPTSSKKMPSAMRSKISVQKQTGIPKAKLIDPGEIKKTRKPEDVKGSNSNIYGKTIVEKTKQQEEQQPLKAKSISPDKIVEAKIQDLKEQLHFYLELCDTMSGGNWQPVDIIDLLYVMVRSLGFEAVTLALIDPESKNKLSRVVSRGYQKPPQKEIFDLWETCIVADVPTINWIKLMGLAEDTQTPLAAWIVDESLQQFGYVPVQDGGKILGFIVVANHQKKEASPFASIIMELCGGRLGLNLGFALKNKADWPSTVLETGMEIRDQLTLIMGYNEMLKSPRQSSKEITELTEKSERSLNETILLLDKITEEAATSI